MLKCDAIDLQFNSWEATCRGALLLIQNCPLSMQAAGFYFAHEFGSKAEVGGHHVLRDALDEFGEAGGKAPVSLFAGGGVDIKAVLLGGGEGALDDEAEISIDKG